MHYAETKKVRRGVKAYVKDGNDATPSKLKALTFAQPFALHSQDFSALEFN